MVNVYIPEDIPMRSTGEGTWVEAGEYEVLRRVDLTGNPRDYRYLIVIKELRKERLLTIVRAEEVEKL